MKKFFARAGVVTLLVLSELRDKAVSTIVISAGAYLIMAAVLPGTELGSALLVFGSISLVLKLKSERQPKGPI